MPVRFYVFTRNPANHFVPIYERLRINGGQGHTPSLESLPTFVPSQSSSPNRTLTALFHHHSPQGASEEPSYHAYLAVMYVKIAFLAP
jgi:hypothetical protein